MCSTSLGCAVVPGGEVQQQGVLGPRVGPSGTKVRRRLRGVGVGQPALGGAADRDAGVGAGHPGELVGVLGPRHHVPCTAAADPVGQIGALQQRCGGDDDRAQLHGGEQRLPQLHLVAEHDDDPVAGGDALRAQPGGDLVGTPPHLLEGDAPLVAVLLHDVQRDALVALGDPVEPVECPVEVFRPRPVEVRAGGVVVLRVPQQDVPGGAELLGRTGARHVSSSCAETARRPGGRW